MGNALRSSCVRVMQGHGVRRLAVVVFRRYVGPPVEEQLDRHLIPGHVRARGQQCQKPRLAVPPSQRRASSTPFPLSRVCARSCLQPRGLLDTPDRRALPQREEANCRCSPSCWDRRLRRARSPAPSLFPVHHRKHARANKRLECEGCGFVIMPALLPMRTTSTVVQRMAASSCEGTPSMAPARRSSCTGPYSGQDMGTCAARVTCTTGLYLDNGSMVALNSISQWRPTKPVSSGRGVGTHTNTCAGCRRLHPVPVFAVAMCPDAEEKFHTGEMPFACGKVQRGAAIVVFAVAVKSLALPSKGNGGEGGSHAAEQAQKGNTREAV